MRLAGRGPRCADLDAGGVDAEVGRVLADFGHGLDDRLGFQGKRGDRAGEVVALAGEGADGSHVIPTASNIDLCIVPGSDGPDALWLSDKGVPGFATGIDDVVVGVIDAVGEVVLAQVLPDVLLRIELGGVGRQVEQADVVGQA